MGNKNDDASNRETIREVAEKWKNLSDEERMKYQRLSDEDKKRYEREMNALSEFFKTHNLPPLFTKRGKIRRDMLMMRTTIISIQLYFPCEF